jgi:hypothetical protein
MAETPLGADNAVPKPSIEANSPADTSTTKISNTSASPIEELEAETKSPEP